MNVIVSNLATEAVTGAYALLKNRFPSSEEKWRSARDEMARDVTFEMESAFTNFLEAFWEYRHETAEAIMAKLDVKTVERIFTRLFFEAMTATTHDRTRLLCAALVGSLNPDYDAEMKSRFIHAILALEPSDIILLRQLNSGATLVTEGKEAVMRNQVSTHALERAGCLETNVASVSSHRKRTLTELGWQLLAFLKAWNPNTSGNG